MIAAKLGGSKAPVITPGDAAALHLVHPLAEATVLTLSQAWTCPEAQPARRLQSNRAGAARLPEEMNAMRSRKLVAVGLALAALAAPVALAEDGYRHGRVRFLEPGVSLQRATEVSAEEAVVNLPFLPGDRVWTDSAGRAEFEFPDGTVVRLDRRSKLDYSAHEEGQEERIVLRLWSGSALVRVRSRDFARFEIETPAGMVRVLDRGIVRADVESGELRLSVYAGEAVLDDGRQPVRLAAGERTFARWGAPAEDPRRFDPAEERGDDFAGWDDLRESEDRGAPRASEYLPQELDPYAGEFERNGQWQYEAEAGFVWVPRVAVGWRPYSNGRWTWTPYGWTWVPYESWGWVPSHYGRWGVSASFGWYWVPGRAWGPGWVSWAAGGGYVGWCPLGRYDRPVRPWHYDRGHSGPRGGYGRADAWNVVRQGDLGRRDVARRHLGLDRVDPDAVRVADSPLFRPTRDGRQLRAGDARAFAISRRQTPGDFVRELGVDNKTTIPAPWTRGYGSPPAGVDGARYGAQRRDGSKRDPDESANGADPGSASASSRRPRPAPSYAPTVSARGGESNRAEGSQTERRRSVDRSGSSERRSPSSLWETLSRRPGGARSEASGARAEGNGSDRPRSDSGARGRAGEYRPRDGGGSPTGSYRPRGDGGSPSGGYRPRGDGGGSGSRSDGAATRPARESGSRARSSGGDGGGSRGGGHAAARPRRENR